MPDSAQQSSTSSELAVPRIPKDTSSWMRAGKLRDASCPCWSSASGGRVTSERARVTPAPSTGFQSGPLEHARSLAAAAHSLRVGSLSTDGNGYVEAPVTFRNLPSSVGTHLLFQWVLASPGSSGPCLVTSSALATKLRANWPGSFPSLRGLAVRLEPLPGPIAVTGSRVRTRSARGRRLGRRGPTGRVGRGRRPR